MPLALGVAFEGRSILQAATTSCRRGIAVSLMRLMQIGRTAPSHAALAR